LGGTSHALGPWLAIAALSVCAHARAQEEPRAATVLVPRCEPAFGGPRFERLLGLELGLAGGFARSFIDEGECLARLLSAAVKSEAPHWSDALLHYARDLLRHMKGAVDKSSEAEAESLELVDPLTEREEEIVTLVAGGASNKAAARQLFVSENTIKFHLKNIYSKLGVTSRLQAVQAARSLHLIE